VWAGWLRCCNKVVLSMAVCWMVAACGCVHMCSFTLTTEQQSAVVLEGSAALNMHP
jgi:hypothetical protein